MQGASLEEADEQLRASVRRQVARHPDIVEEQEAALAEALHLERAQRDKVSYWRKAALKAGRPDWYGGADEGSRIWQTLRRRLKEIGRSEDEIESVEMDSTAVLSLADNPGQARFPTRGLVLGHRSEEKTHEHQLLIHISYDVLCWKKK